MAFLYFSWNFIPKSGPKITEGTFPKLISVERLNMYVFVLSLPCVNALYLIKRVIELYKSKEVAVYCTRDKQTLE